MKDFSFIVHSCPQRRQSIAETLLSIEASDIPFYRVCRHEEGLNRNQIRQWFLDTLVTESKNCEFLVRFEDDVVVNKHIYRNLRQWKALQAPDFGIGRLFFYDNNDRNKTLGWRHNSWYRIDYMYEGAQGDVYKSEHIDKVVDGYFRAHKEHPNAPGFGFDWPVSRALGYHGLKTYVHLPSLVNCNKTSAIRVLTGENHGGHYSHITYDENWKAGIDEEIVPIIW